MGVKEKPDITDIIERKILQWYDHVKRMQEERLTKLIMEWIPEERRKTGRPRKTWMEGLRVAMKKKTFRRRSVVKQKGMVFGFRKTATAVTRPEK
jgi:IS5 family transposase